MTLGRSIYYISYYLIYLSTHDSLFSSFYTEVIRTEGVYGANEGGVNNGGRFDSVGLLEKSPTSMDPR